MNKMLKIFIQILLLITISILPNYSSADTFDGRIKKIIDGDSLVIGSIMVRLFGIDAPEYYQLCPSRSKPFRCGIEATKFLKDKFKYNHLRCTIKAVDIYNRTIAVCFDVKSSKDLAEALVENGWAFSLSSKYKSYMLKAISKCLGIWKYGIPIKPVKWRKLHRGNSIIKNISLGSKLIGIRKKCTASLK